MTAEDYRITRNETIRQSNMERYGFGPAAMQSIRICAECGMPAAALERKCRECGVKLPQETLFQQYKKRHRFCPHCDTVVARSALFCPECGMRIRIIRD